MRRVGVGGIVGALTMCLVIPPAYAWGPSQKLTRGITNAATGWMELPIQIARTTELEGTIAGLSTGLLRGIGRTLGRTIAGLYEIITFPTPNYYPPQGVQEPYGPIFEPNTVIFRAADKP